MPNTSKTDAPCDQFVGRIRDICRGHDDLGQPVLTPEKCAAYRKLWGVERDQPTTLQRAGSFFKAVVEHVIDGGRTASDEAYDVRMALCAGCDEFDAERAACRLCGCNMTRKARWASSACPIGKWGKQ